MSSSFDSHPSTIGQLLGDNERRSVMLPQFQRGFSWEKSHVERFWADLTNFKSSFDSSPISASYFLGPIVLKPENEQLVLLDGQQRLATATILLAAMRDIARGLDAGHGYLGADFARDIQVKYIQKGDDEPTRFSLVLGELDEPYFMAAIQKDPPVAPTCVLRSHRLIAEARTLLSEKLNATIATRDAESAVKALKSLRDCLV